MKINSPFRTGLACLAITLMFALAARADAPDTSTPKKTALIFAKAVQAGDLDAAKKVATGTDAEWNLIKMLSDMIVAMKAFSTAAADKFGDQGKLPPGMAMDLVAEFDASDEKIDGDKATLVSKEKPDDPYPATFKKTATGWIMDLSNMDKDPSSAGMSQMLPVMTKSFATVTADIKAGKYQSMTEAMNAFGQLMSASAPAGAAPAASAPGQ